MDHFIPWSRYPVDLGHNFVLAHKACIDAGKGDLLAAAPHLRRWWERVETRGTLLAKQFDAKLLVHDVAASREITRWACESADVDATVAMIGRLIPSDRRPNSGRGRQPNAIQ